LPLVVLYYLISLGLIGLGEIGNVVCSLSLVTGARVPRASRGSVAGVYSAFGAAGILFHSKVGGYLFDSWDSGAPFFIMGVSHVVVVVLACVVFIFDSCPRKGDVALDSEDRDRSD
jgi:predicted MFS family arabinose efflux permease